ncbi:hypothetical protein L13192_00415 [Pyrenophora tritici-repentis]|nr:hypothetical protein L13192_00415 [Pyrenophora tritici-repentis]
MVANFSKIFLLLVTAMTISAQEPPPQQLYRGRSSVFAPYPYFLSRSATLNFRYVTMGREGTLAPATQTNALVGMVALHMTPSRQGSRMARRDLVVSNTHGVLNHLRYNSGLWWSKQG